ncbi:molybdenum cofactor biosynthesis protein MoaE [Methanobacterium sp. ACI-7]|uniref:molybdenum cofactor biosynthesis protein MoaE n=1 Tax=unclassified Methanobacterium TaxID=2627676 RepID=UPI0039C45C4D
MQNVMIIKKDEDKITIPDLIKRVKKNKKIDHSGAIFTFEGIVRGEEDKVKVKKLSLSTPDIEKTEKELKEIISEITERFGVIEIAAVHYVGEFYTGDSLLLVVVAGAHRGETLDALKETIERIKFDLDFKKEELTEKGTNIIMSGG